MTSLRFDQRTITRVFVCFGAILTILAPPTPSLGADAKSLRARAWDQCLDSANSVPAVRYSLYAYRSLAVQHPEIYLEADQLISEVLEDLPGSRLAYRSRDVRDVELYLRLARREMKGGAFGLGMMTITPDSIFDLAPVRFAFGWLDLRAPSAAVLLKSVSPRLSTLECALLRYAQLTRTGWFSDDLFVVVDEKGTGYLAADTVLWQAGLSDRPVAKWKDVSPVLVFNRRAVFSSLVGRDDRDDDSLLSRLMDKLGRAASPSFGSEDTKRFARIKDASSLPNGNARQLAVLAASGLVDRKQPRVHDKWSEYAGTDSVGVACATSQLDEVFFWANRLSLRTAELADLMTKSEFSKSMTAVQEKYLSWAGRRVSPHDSTDLRVEAWGCLWSYDLFETLIDDNIRTQAGSSSSHASAMSAVLDLAAVDHFQLSVRLGDKQIPDQEWLFAGNGRYQFNLGIWTTVPDSIPPGVRPTTLLISGFALRGNSVRLRGGSICAGMDALTLGEHLARISRLMPLANFMLLAPNDEVTALQKFLFDLTDDRYQFSAAKWPPTSSQ